MAVTVTGEVDTAKLDGYFKKIYADEIERAIPDDIFMPTWLKFRPDEAEGESYDQPVHLIMPLGVSFSRITTGSFNLNAPIGGTVARALVNGSQHAIRNAFSWDIAKRSSRSQAAYNKYMGENALEMKAALMNFLECDYFYGQQGLGTVEAVNTNAITITAATWATGFWMGKEGVPLTFWTSNAIGGTFHKATTLSTIDVENRILNVASGTSVAPGDIIFFGKDPAAGAPNNSCQLDGAATSTAYNSMVGLEKIAQFSSGTMFNIASTVSALWRGNQYGPVNDQLSFPVLQKALARSRGRGSSGPVKVMVSPTTMADLISDQAALRRYGVSTEDFENGASGLLFNSPFGKMTVVPSTFVKQGQALIFNPKKFKRLGSSDISFTLDDVAGGGAIYRIQTDNMGVEYRGYSNQCIFTSKPGHVTVVTGIANAA